MRAFCALPCRSATTRNGSPASGSAASTSAPRPLASTKRPRSPRALATRSGKACKSSAPDATPPSPAAWSNLPVKGEGDACRAIPSASFRAAVARGDFSAINRNSRRSRSDESPPRPRSVSSTASRAASAACPCPAATATMWASRTGSASFRIAWPAGVSRPASSIAPSAESSARASDSAGDGGGSRNASVAGSATPKAAQSRTRPDRSASRISGGEKAGSAAVCSARHRRIATPGPVRPARPARWSAEARDTRTVSSRVRPVDGSYFGSRASPLSITTRTPSMVMDVLRNRSRQHHLAPPGRRRADRRVLRAPVEIAVERHHVDVGADAALQQRGSALDLALAGQEGEHAAALLRQRLPHRACNRILHRRARRALGMARLDRKAPAGALHHRGVAEQARDPRAVERRRHDQQPQVRPQGALHVERQREAEIGIQRTLVELVEKHGGDAREFRIVEDHARQDALGRDEDPCARGHPGFHAHGIADRAPRLFAEKVCHAPRCGPRRQPSRLQHDDTAVAAPGCVEQHQWHQRGLAGAGRGHQHGAAALGQGIPQRRQGGRHRQVRQLEVSAHVLRIGHAPPYRAAGCGATGERGTRRWRPHPRKHSGSRKPAKRGGP